ncbi:MAG: alpha-galactosidase, partial [Actinomycetota bacterium]|nr:alpha-galactosidase [Actinomycetota bacterium]
MPDGTDAVLILRAAGVSIVIDAAARVPRVLHWGADLGALDASAAEALRQTATPAVLNNSPDAPRTLTLWPTEFDSWAGTPAQSGNAAGTATTPRLELVSTRWEVDPAGGGEIAFDLIDHITALRSELTLRLDNHGVLAIDMAVIRDVSLADG